MGDDVLLNIEEMNDVGEKYIGLLEITTDSVKAFNQIEEICGQIKSTRNLQSIGYLEAKASEMKKIRDSLDAEYTVLNHVISEFIRTDEELARYLRDEIIKDEDGQYKDRVEDKEYEIRAKEVAKILEEILGKQQYIDENGRTIVFNQIEARNLYSKDEFKLHEKVIIKRTELPDGQYVDCFIDADTGEQYKRIGHVLSGTNQEAIKYGIQKDKVYIENETYSDDSVLENYKSWGFSIANSLVQDGYGLAELSCYVMYFNDSQTRNQKIQSIEIRKNEAENYFRGKSRSQEEFKTAEQGYRVYEIVGMILSIGDILANAPKILSKIKGGATKALNVIDACIDGAKSFLKDAKKMEIPSMEDIVAGFNRLTNNNQFQPALEGVNYSKYVDDVGDVKGVRVDKVEGDTLKGMSNSGANNYVNYLKYKGELAKAELKEMYPDFVEKKNSRIAQTSDTLLKKELEFAPYGELEKIPFDNLTGHHMPSNYYMKEKFNIDMGDSLAFNLEQLSPGVGGRHRRTFTYGFKGRGKELYLNLMPRDALAFDINDVIRILKEDGLYNSESRKAISEYINYYKRVASEVFKK